MKRKTILAKQQIMRERLKKESEDDLRPRVYYECGRCKKVRVLTKQDFVPERMVCIWCENPVPVRILKKEYV